ncbi:Cytochrome P450 3A24 [Trametes pubescens]|uniref:Cytochrome P450 3A24 n=1 Tax=Trametes pubescens TaxID=154538 RepID=A0A1M2V342_TRAPU|nr:Cytochrome P450 3A24 [Trametes pubescens]
MSPMSQLAGYAFALFVGWRLLRSTFFKSPLDNIPGVASDSLIGGNIQTMFHLRAGWTFEEEVAKYGRVSTFHGFFGTKLLFTFDPRALHAIYVKDQDVYEESAIFISMFDLCLGPGLISTLGEQHRRQRKMLNPLFSAKHLRGMTPIFTNIIHKLEDAIGSRVKDGAHELDILNWMGRVALELIGQGGLGYSFDPLTKDVADEFVDSVKAFFAVQAQLNTIVRYTLPILVRIGPAAFRRKVVEMLPRGGASQHMMRISDTLAARSLDIVNEKKQVLQHGDAALKQQVGEGKDIMSVLLRENMRAAEADRLSDEEVVAQVSTLVLAAADTTSNALARIFHQLCLHSAVQEKLREEIIQARDDGTGKLRDLDYDEVMELPYLDAVCRETMRRFPPVTTLLRIVRKDAILPLSAPIRGIDGAMMDAIPVRKGMHIVTGVQACNTNEELWGPDADEWKPERWMKPLPRAVEEAHIPGVYSNLMTFVGGARACIGFKFAQLEMKVVLATLIPAFSFELTDKPIEWNDAGVAYPSVGESFIPEMPLRVTRLRL